MKILYYSDNYTYDNFGTKRSIYLEMKRQGHDVKWVPISQIRDILDEVIDTKPRQVWLVHSGLSISADIKRSINDTGTIIVGIGMSDPNYFSDSRLKSYNAYITNSIYIYDKYKDKLPCFYHRTACDFRFHRRDLSVNRNIHASMIGLARHPYFPNKDERKEIVDQLRDQGIVVHAYGNGWPSHQYNFPHIEGVEFRSILQRSHIGLDIQNELAPLAHRMFEYAACGTPVITRRRDEVTSCFEEDKEIILYGDRNELIYKVKYYLEHPDILNGIGNNAFSRCLEEHDIRHRITLLLPFIEGLTLD